MRLNYSNLLFPKGCPHHTRPPLSFQLSVRMAVHQSPNIGKYCLPANGCPGSAGKSEQSEGFWLSSGAVLKSTPKVGSVRQKKLSDSVHIHTNDFRLPTICMFEFGGIHHHLCRDLGLLRVASSLDVVGLGGGLLRKDWMLARPNPEPPCQAPSRGMMARLWRQPRNRWAEGPSGDG